MNGALFKANCRQNIYHITKYISNLSKETKIIVVLCLICSLIVLLNGLTAFQNCVYWLLIFTRCGLSFRHDSTLTMHVRTRHDHLRPFKCDECNNTFGRLSHLKKHIKKVCGNKKNKEKPVVQCKFCDNTFPTKVSKAKSNSDHGSIYKDSIKSDG